MSNDSERLSDQASDESIRPMTLTERLVRTGLRAARWYKAGTVRAKYRTEAYRYTDMAAGCTEAETAQRGIYRYKSGQAYRRAGLLIEARYQFEAARPDLETYKRLGTKDGFMKLASLYGALAFVYRENDQPEELLEVQAQAEELTAEIEAHFGKRVEFTPQGYLITELVQN